MALLTCFKDANDWLFVRGVTGADSLDPLGPMATCAKITGKGGDHYVGAYSTGKSTATLRTFFDGLDTTTNDIGYIVTVNAYCFGQPLNPRVLPALLHQRQYIINNNYLDFMGGIDARARFAGLNSGGRQVNAPFYPFNKFLEQGPNRLYSHFDEVFWHPLTNGSLRRGNGLDVPDNSCPANGAARSRVASCRAVVRPFLIQQADLDPICTADTAAFDGHVDAALLDASNLFSAVQALYFQEFGETLPIIKDAKAAGEYLILITEDGSAIVARLGDRIASSPKPVYLLKLWEVDHDSFERLEHQVATRTLADLHQWMQYDSAPVQALTMPGRGSRPLNRPANLGFMTGQPTLSLDYTATLVEWVRETRQSQPTKPDSSVSVRFDWVFDPFDETFDLIINKPRHSNVEPPVGDFCKKYQAVLGATDTPTGDATDTQDLRPYILAGAPRQDDAPLTPTHPIFSYQG